MIVLIKIIQAIGQATMFFRNTFFAEPVFSLAYEGALSAVLGTLRRRIVITVAVCAIASIGIAVFLMYSIVANEYALKRIFADFRAEEELLSAVLVQHAQLISPQAVFRVIENNPDDNLVSVETIKYIRSDSILQASALLQLR